MKNSNLFRFFKLLGLSTELLISILLAIFSYGWGHFWFLPYGLIVAIALIKCGKSKLNFLVLGALSAILHLLQPQAAHALMFSGAETFLVAAFPQVTPLINFLFNALRLLFLVFFGVSAINIVRAIMNGQDVLSALQTPAIIALVIVVVDIITTLFLGS